MTGAKRGGRYPDEMRERAVRMLFEHQHEYPSQWQAIESISEKLSINHETLRNPSVAAHRLVTISGLEDLLQTDADTQRD